MDAAAYPPAYPHDPIEAITDDVFMVRGSIKLNALMKITRNMAIRRRLRLFDKFCAQSVSKRN